MAPTHGVLFDVGYALLDEGPRLEGALGQLADLLRALGIVTDVPRLAALYRAACVAPREASLFVQIARDAGATDAQARDLRRRLRWDALPLVPLPGARAALERLAQAGLRLGVLANQPASAREDLARAGLAPLLDGVWLSEDTGLLKPDPAFFRLALDAWGLPPARVAYVGDRPDNDVGPARALGMHAVRLRFGPHAVQRAAGPHEEADHDAATLADAAEHLVGWARRGTR
jgi:putative hydrolase of the HAD superfamily